MMEFESLFDFILRNMELSMELSRGLFMGLSILAMSCMLWLARKVYLVVRDQQKKESYSRSLLFWGYKPTPSQRIAREIMGSNFFGPEEWEMYYGMTFTSKQLENIPEFPWPKDVLNSPCSLHPGMSMTVGQTHFAFLGPGNFRPSNFNGMPLTINRWSTINSVTGCPWFGAYQPDLLHGNENFFRKFGYYGLRWYLMPIDIMPGSGNKK